MCSAAKVPAGTMVSILWLVLSSLLSTSSDILSKYVRSSSSCCWFSTFTSLVLACCPVKKAVPIPTTIGIARTPRSCSQSHNVLPDLLFPLNPVQSNLYPTIINATAITRMIATTSIVTRCCFICFHHEQNLALIAPPLLRHDLF